MKKASKILGKTLSGIAWFAKQLILRSISFIAIIIVAALTTMALLGYSFVYLVLCKNYNEKLSYLFHKIGHVMIYVSDE